MSRTHHPQETITDGRIKDLKLAASFVKSIETADHGVNLEIQRVAQQIESIAGDLNARQAKEVASQHP